MTDVFAEIVGRDHVRIDARSLERFSNDSFYWPRGRVCRAVIAPGSPEEVTRVVRAASALGCAIICRGSGFSYTGGYVPHQDESVILDMRRLDHVREINAVDQYVTIEAGCTWEMLTRALEATDLRPVFRPPHAAGAATIGGTITNGTAEDSTGILSIEAVIGTGKLIQTGSAARAAHASPFLRQFGPDLTGLFIGDGGTFGVKTAVTLALEPLPRAVKQASYAFETFEATMRATVACSRLRLPGLIWAKGPEWSLTLTTEGPSERGVKDALRLLIDLCKREGREISVQRVEAEPGVEHRVSSNAIIQMSSAENVATRTRQFFGAHRAQMQAHDITESYVVTARPGAIGLDMALSWRGDEQTPRVVASEVCELLRKLLTDLGAAHVELAKAYAYRSVLSPQFADAWDRIRRALDPDGRLNPGNLDR
jgi:D-lactate dehydrogenase (cytochrome)